ncbi:MAG TPA: hypothetical protein VIM70_18870 [Clostridium sp.]|uniref:hypothetical protein n=1 Tax=Clostridium sp. TaxID=1506 RepID=UPI002F9325C8
MKKNTSLIFCPNEFEFNNIKYNAVIDCHNKPVSMFFILLLNMINMLIRITERLFK